MPTIEELFEIEIENQEPSENQYIVDRENNYPEKYCGDEDKILANWLESRQKEKFIHITRNPKKSLNNLFNPKYNFNATLVTENKPIKTIADSIWPNNFGMVFRSDTPLWIAFFHNDIGSVRFPRFDKDGHIYTSIAFDLARWHKNNLDSSKCSMKLTHDSAIAKIDEIIYRMDNEEHDHSSTEYLDINNNFIFTGENKKFSKRIEDSEQEDVKTLRCNETHLRCDLNDLEGIAILEKDFLKLNLKSESSSYFKKAVKFCNEIEKIKNSIKNPQYSDIYPKDNPKNFSESYHINKIKENFCAKIAYYESLKEQLKIYKEEFSKNIEAIENNDDFHNNLLSDAFRRKKVRNVDFDENSLENKKKWLQKHIAKIDRDCSEINIAIQNLKKENNEDLIKENLDKELEFYTYDCKTGLMSKIDKDKLIDKIAQSDCFYSEFWKLKARRIADFTSKNKLTSLGIAITFPSTIISNVDSHINATPHDFGKTTFVAFSYFICDLPIYSLAGFGLNSLYKSATKAYQEKSVCDSGKILTSLTAGYFLGDYYYKTLRYLGISETASTIHSTYFAISLSSYINAKLIPGIENIASKAASKSQKLISKIFDLEDKTSLPEINPTLTLTNCPQIRRVELVNLEKENFEQFQV